MQIRLGVRRALSSFLAIPIAIVVLFLAVGAACYWLDRWNPAAVDRFRGVMEEYLFGDAESTAQVLSTIAAGLITVTSITFSLLLLALQQSASSLTEEVFDQFLLRRANQIYVGFFVGLSLFALLTLATVDSSFNPVVGASVTLLLTVVGLAMLLLLVYSTISEMRPTSIVQAIHNHTLGAWDRQRPTVDRTRRTERLPHLPALEVRAPAHGYLAWVDLDAIATVLDTVTEPVEVVVDRPIGSFVAFGDRMAQVRAARPEDAAAIARCLEGAMRLDMDRILDTDPGHGVEQLVTIAWRSISTSQHNMLPGLAVTDMLHDLLARWGVPQEDRPPDAPMPVVYPDTVVRSVVRGLESLAVVASEAMQHEIHARILTALASTFPRLTPDLQQEVEALLLRTLAGLGDHMLTGDLDAALHRMEETLDACGRSKTAAALRAAHGELAQSVGKLNSRATRVPSG